MKQVKPFKVWSYKTKAVVTVLNMPLTGTSKFSFQSETQAFLLISFFYFIFFNFFLIFIFSLSCPDSFGKQNTGSECLDMSGQIYNTVQQG